MEDWVSVLKLSTRWHFNRIRGLAITHLAAIAMDPVDKVVLAKKYKVRDWLQSGYESLVSRSTMISLEEAEKIGYQTAHLLYQARESAAVRNRPYGYNDMVLGHIERIFGDEVRAMEIEEVVHTGRPLRVLSTCLPSTGRISAVRMSPAAGGKKKKLKK
jgi:hypothetical protein